MIEGGAYRSKRVNLSAPLSDEKRGQEALSSRHLALIASRRDANGVENPKDDGVGVVKGGQYKTRHQAS
jgi:hypothetical protein